MYKANFKKYFKKIIAMLICVFVIYSLYIQLEYRDYVNQSIDRNYDYLSIISVQGDNLANRLEEFVHLTIEQGNSEVKRELYNNWRIVNGESKSIHSYLYAISTIHMGKAASDWDLLQYSLFRVDEFISGMTNKFLENHSYTINNDERDKMEAVITVFRTINKEKSNEIVDIKTILESIKEPMLIIDNNYSNILERIGK